MSAVDQFLKEEDREEEGGNVRVGRKRGEGREEERGRRRKGG